jgi:anti-sigma factor RsiW
MNCEGIEAQLIAYLDGKAREAEGREVEAHLAACGACRARADEFRRLWGVLEEAAVLEPSLGFDARLRRVIAAEPQPALFAWLIPSMRMAVAVTALVLLSVWISSVPPGDNSAPVAKAEEEFIMIRDLPVLEDYDVLANFEVLSELPAAKPRAPQKM